MSHGSQRAGYSSNVIPQLPCFSFARPAGDGFQSADWREIHDLRAHRSHVAFAHIANDALKFFASVATLGNCIGGILQSVPEAANWEVRAVLAGYASPTGYDTPTIALAAPISTVLSSDPSPLTNVQDFFGWFMVHTQADHWYFWFEDMHHSPGPYDGDYRTDNFGIGHSFGLRVTHNTAGNAILQGLIDDVVVRTSHVTTLPFIPPGKPGVIAFEDVTFTDLANTATGPDYVDNYFSLSEFCASPL